MIILLTITKFVRADNITRNPHIFKEQSNLWRTIVGSYDKYLIKLKVHACNNLGSAVGESIYCVLPSLQYRKSSLPLFNGSLLPNSFTTFSEIIAFATKSI